LKIEHKKRAGFASVMVLLAACSLLAEQFPKEVPRETPKGADVAVIVNPLNPVESISLVELRKLFFGEKRSWSSSLPAFVVVRAPEAHEREVLLYRVLRMTESEYKQYWVRKVYSGEVQREPLMLFSNGMQLEAVRAEKGGIALISMQDVRQGVKVLKVEGFLPGTPGYPLK
jgi:ABC-type phosphate transport system substrate-binding protein